MIYLIICGIHTFSAGMVLTHKQFKKIWETCYNTGYVENKPDFWKVIERLYCYAYHKQGVKVYLCGKSGKLYHLRVQIEPCLVLGESDPTALAKMDKRQYKALVKAVDKIFKKPHIPGSIDTMKISRCDLTVNIEFSTQEELMEYLRIFKKSFRIYHYRLVSFKKNEQKAKDYKLANSHSYCISCDCAGFLIYDKVAQLKMVGRLDEDLREKHILRFEAELKRPALKTHLGKAALKANYNLLFLAAHDSRKVIRWYLKRMQPECEKAAVLNE